MDLDIIYDFINMYIFCYFKREIDIVKKIQMKQVEFCEMWFYVQGFFNKLYGYMYKVVIFVCVDKKVME